MSDLGGELEGVPVVPWPEHLEHMRVNWRQGQHVALVGPTGQGKTTLALRLLELRKWVVILATKPKDATLSGLRRQGYKILRRWPPPSDTFRRVILWPTWRDPADSPKQQGVFKAALYAVFGSGGWTVFADDTQYLTKHLGLGRVLSALWINSRSLNVTVIGGTQRPRWVPVDMWANSSHVYVWGTANPEDLKTLAGLAGLDVVRVRKIVAQLPEFYCLYIPTRTRGGMMITKVDV